MDARGARVLLLTILLASAITAATFTIKFMTTAALPQGHGNHKILVKVINRKVINRSTGIGVYGIYFDGKLVKVLPLAEGDKIQKIKIISARSLNNTATLWEGEIKVPSVNALRLNMEKAMEIVENSPEVRKAIGEEFKVLASKVTTNMKTGEAKATVTVLVKSASSKYYEVIVNVSKGIVESIKKIPRENSISLPPSFFF